MILSNFHNFSHMFTMNGLLWLFCDLKRGQKETAPCGRSSASLGSFKHSPLSCWNLSLKMSKAPHPASPDMLRPGVATHCNPAGTTPTVLVGLLQRNLPRIFDLAFLAANGEMPRTWHGESHGRSVHRFPSVLLWRCSVLCFNLSHKLHALQNCTKNHMPTSEEFRHDAICHRIQHTLCWLNHIEPLPHFLHEFGSCPYEIDQRGPTTQPAAIKMRCGDRGNEELASISVLLQRGFWKDSWDLVRAWHDVTWHVLPSSWLWDAVGNGSQLRHPTATLFVPQALHLNCGYFSQELGTLVTPKQTRKKWILQPSSTLQIFEISESLHLASIGHGEKTSTFMLQLEVLIGKLLPSAHRARGWGALCWDPLALRRKQRIVDANSRKFRLKHRPSLLAILFQFQNIFFWMLRKSS